MKKAKSEDGQACCKAEKSNNKHKKLGKLSLNKLKVAKEEAKVATENSEDLCDQLAVAKELLNCYKIDYKDCAKEKVSEGRGGK